MLPLDDPGSKEFGERVERIIDIFENVQNIPFEDSLKERQSECRKEIAELDEKSIEFYLKLVKDNSKLQFDVTLEDNKKKLEQLIKKHNEFEKIFNNDKNVKESKELNGYSIKLSFNS